MITTTDVFHGLFWSQRIPLPMGFGFSPSSFSAYIVNYHSKTTWYIMASLTVLCFVLIGGLSVLGMMHFSLNWLTEGWPEEVLDHIHKAKGTIAARHCPKNRDQDAFVAALQTLQRVPNHGALTIAVPTADHEIVDMSVLYYKGLPKLRYQELRTTLRDLGFHTALITLRYHSKEVVEFGVKTSYLDAFVKRMEACRIRRDIDLDPIHPCDNPTPEDVKAARLRFAEGTCMLIHTKG